MSWWSEFADRIEADAPLHRLTWFRLGGRARYLVHPRSVDDLACMVRRARQEGLSVRILGAGANVLIRDAGVEAVVVRLDHGVFREVHRRGGELTAGAGVDLMPLVRECSERGLSGLECMAGIPATVGGAVRMNAGGRFGEIASVVRSIAVLHDEKGTVETWPRPRIGFGYRHTELNGHLVLSATFDLVEDDPRKTTATFEEYFAYKQQTQPLADKSAGCIFKNPPGQSAGAIIDHAGLKGTAVGGASVSHRHANFIVTQPGATATDVVRLIELVQQGVRERAGIDLEIEIDIW